VLKNFGLVSPMKANVSIITKFSCAFLLWLTPGMPFRSFAGLQQEISAAEYAALVDLYMSTDGPNWINNERWNDPDAPSWHGVILGGGHVIDLYLDRNRLRGGIPHSVGNLVWLQEVLDLSKNELTGSIPSALANVGVERIWLQGNQLSGSIPDFSISHCCTVAIDISYNCFDISPGSQVRNVMEKLIEERGPFALGYGFQPQNSGADPYPGCGSRSRPTNMPPWWISIEWRRAGTG
jgi:hypothetical protein